ncbi:MAG TPA: hypothetical protein VLI06_01975 [Solimonas sp.]|nr:hypothetical protein [Solimonas sp.]
MFAAPAGTRDIAVPRAAFAALLLFAFLCPMTSWTIARGALSYADFALVLSLLLMLPAIFSGRLLPFVPFFLVATGTCMLFIGLVSAEMEDNLIGVLDCMKLVVAMMVTPLVVAWGLQDRPFTRAYWLLSAWLAGATFSALVGISSRHGISLLGFHDIHAAAGQRIFGLTYHSTSLGYCSAIALAAGLLLTLGTRSWLLRLLGLGSIGILLYAIHLSGSRASVIGALSVLLPFMLFLLTRLHNLRLRIALFLGSAGVIGLIVVLALGGLPIDDPGSALGRLLGRNSSVQYSNSVREILHDYAWKGFFESPVFGRGFHNIRIAHNYTLQLLHSGGVLALFVVLAWALALLHSYLQTRGTVLRLDRPLREQLLWVTLTALFMGWFAHALTQTFITDRNGYFWVTLILALGFHVRRLQLAHSPAVIARQ